MIYYITIHVIMPNVSERCGSRSGFYSTYKPFRLAFAAAVTLAGVNAASDSDDVLLIGALLDQSGHIDGLLVVDDHALHEQDIRRGMAGVSKLYGIFAR